MDDATMLLTIGFVIGFAIGFLAAAVMAAAWFVLATWIAMGGARARKEKAGLK